MSMDDLYQSKRSEALRRWTDAVYALYPFQTPGFLRTQHDRFTNPVGHTTMSTAEILYDAVTGREVDPTVVNEALAALIRIRAVQELRPDQAVGALMLLAPVLREFFLTEALSRGRLDDFLDVLARLDSLLLLAFNLYTEDREALYAERAAECRREQAQLRRWAERRGFKAQAPDSPFDV